MLTSKNLWNREIQRFQCVVHACKEGRLLLHSEAEDVGATKLYVKEQGWHISRNLLELIEGLLRPSANEDISSHQIYYGANLRCLFNRL